MLFLRSAGHQLAGGLFAPLERLASNPILDWSVSKPFSNLSELSGAVIMIGMIEKAVFYAEYSNMNATGQSIEGLIEAIFICF